MQLRNVQLINGTYWSSSGVLYGQRIFNIFKCTTLLCQHITVSKITGQYQKYTHTTQAIATRKFCILNLDRFVLQFFLNVGKVLHEGLHVFTLSLHLLVSKSFEWLLWGSHWSGDWLGCRASQRCLLHQRREDTAHLWVQVVRCLGSQWFQHSLGQGFPLSIVHQKPEICQITSDYICPGTQPILGI